MTRSALLFLLFVASAAPAIEPQEVVVVFNTAVPQSRDVAEHYAIQRKVPTENLIGLKLPDHVDMSRLEYDELLAAPLRKALAGREKQIKVLLTVYGVPLRIRHLEPAPEAKKQAEALLPKLEAARKANDPKARQLEQQYVELINDQNTAAVDSELALLLWPKYSINRWVINPLYWQIPDSERAKLKAPVLFTSRLDGPTPAIAKRLVDLAMEAEAAGGPEGVAYIDARGLKYDPAKDDGTGMAGYDESFREAAKILEAGGHKVVLDDREELFPENGCPNCSLYLGWYALTKYRKSFTFVPGAVAWHLASYELTDLREVKSNQWGVNLLNDGAAATLGPVTEPYTVGFPKPAEFVTLLGCGKYTLVEAYARSQLLTSWMTALVGDPLYRPYAKKPFAREEDLRPSPKGSRPIKP